MQNPRYTAIILDENGADQGPADVSGAQDDNQVRELAKREGMKWLAENGATRATVKISRNGYGLPIVEVRTQCLDSEMKRPSAMPGLCVC